ncbi:MAG: STAS domain-containing protein [Pseudomonadota bacterium]
MNLDHEIRGDVAILRPVGRLDSATSPELERSVIECLDAGCKRLVFDLAAMDYVSSAGLRVILVAGKKLRATQGKLVLSGMREAVRDVFEMSGFLNLFAVTTDLDDAIAKV